MQTAPHLHFNGNCGEAFKAYADTLGGEIAFSLTYGEAPGAEKAPPELRNKIIHARLDLGGQFLTGCDVPPGTFQAPQGFNVLASIAKLDEAERAFKTLSQGGTVTMHFAETFWAKGFGMCTDRFGIPWMINCEKPLADVAPARKSA
ncbi:MAG TPA: VOC family protein [Steroidobacteraceae bacterium]|jgi:PhnB protein|nr:VOC family protein [Steroidobacteraceae bacterium]